VEFPNPLSEICGTDDREVEQEIDIPFAKGKTQKDETHIENCISVNNLKSRRTYIYGTITKGEKTLMKKIQRSDQSEWPIIQARTRESFESLTRIMDNLQMIGFERTPGEATKYLNYSSRLKKMMAKIDHLIETLQANIPGMVENLLEQYVQEEEDFCESLTDRTSRTSRLGYAPESMF
jgi:iron uptake system EfeUOB component EfeO/EfeM